MHCLHEFFFFLAMWMIWDLPFVFLQNIREVTTWDLSHSTEGESWPDLTQKKKKRKEKRGDS